MRRTAARIRGWVANAQFFTHFYAAAGRRGIQIMNALGALQRRGTDMHDPTRIDLLRVSLLSGRP